MMKREMMNDEEWARREAMWENGDNFVNSRRAVQKSTELAAEGSEYLQMMSPFSTASFARSGSQMVVKGTSQVVKNIAKNRGVQKGTILYRVWGKDSKPLGGSWTTKNPAKVHRINKKYGSSYREAAGLPNGNSGDNIIVARVKNTKGIKTRNALEYDGNRGGLFEVYNININNIEEQLEIIGGMHLPRGF